MLVGAPAPAATAQPCPDVEVVFARGTGEAPGVGGIGQSFVDMLRNQAAPRTVNVYAVNYAASDNFSGGVDFARTVVDGIRDAGSHIQATAANCPDTRIVLGGFSQGAAVAGYVTSAQVPANIPPAYASYIPQPLAPEIADHVAAVTLFGKPSDAFLGAYGAPPIVIGPLYAPKTTELCAQGDTICDGTPGGQPSVAHALYGVNGMTAQAATFVVGRL
ncbi:cutinase family protein [Mycobacterium sp. CPCC 205372]|uniref:Cutinase family protein n=2 Tax=Mycobacterium hippophais TaxID=3016340 RepID=A0ABT4PNE0_9MYCO|nr:cutinase family protein [Mycobacterium hippophais]MCZ8378072.1 cutinase family protein [Mycobacterium hippophais]